LSLLGLDFNIEATGFDKIGFRIASLEVPSETGDELAYAA
jgi:hypothetical protein